MWRTTRVQYGAANTLISVMAALLSVVVLTSISLAAATEAHSRKSRTVPRAATRVVKPPTKILNPDHDILIRLEKGQRALEKHATDLEAAIRKQVDQLSHGIEDSRKEAQQMLEATGKRIKLTQRLLTIIISLLMVLYVGGFYFAQRLTRLENKLSVRAMKPNQQDEQAVEWQEGKPPKG
jgi:predicted PurR-regulated permease PerM